MECIGCFVFLLWEDWRSMVRVCLGHHSGIRQHTSAYVSIRMLTYAFGPPEWFWSSYGGTERSSHGVGVVWKDVKHQYLVGDAYVSIREHTYADETRTHQTVSLKKKKTVSLGSGWCERMCEWNTNIWYYMCPLLYTGTIYIWWVSSVVGVIGWNKFWFWGVVLISLIENWSDQMWLGVCFHCHSKLVDQSWLCFWNVVF
jgi:hypothetical protein